MTVKVQSDERPAVVAGTPTQVANPGRATLRTVVAVIVGLIVALPTINSILLVVQDELTKQTDFTIPAWVWLVINIALGVIALITGLITRILAIPGVNEWIKAHVPGLAAIPLVPIESAGKTGTGSTV